MHSHKFLYMKHCWSNKGHMGMKRLRSEVCILLKHHADQWKLSHFKFSITSQIHRPFLWLLLDLKLPNMGRKIWKTNSVTYPFYLFVGKFPKLFNFSDGKEKSYLVELNIFKENMVYGLQKILLHVDNFPWNFYIWSAIVNGTCVQKIKIGHWANFRAKSKCFPQILFLVGTILRSI